MNAVSKKLEDPNYYRDLDENIRGRMLEILQETMDRVAQHCAFVQAEGRRLPWKERTALSLRFRLMGPTNAVFSDEWSRVTYRTDKEGRFRRNLQYLQTRARAGQLSRKVMPLTRSWERQATADMLDYLHAARVEWSSLAKARSEMHRAATIAGQPFEPQPMPRVRQRAIVEATIAAMPEVDESPPETSGSDTENSPYDPNDQYKRYRS
jgi:hypothetical protein